MGGHHSRMFRDIPLLTKALKDSKSFRKGSLFIHDSINNKSNKFYDALHESAFPEDRVEPEEKKELEDKTKR